MSYLCIPCGFLYEEESGLPERDIPSGTSWDAIPEDWRCPECGAPKSLFAPIDIEAPGGARSA